MKKLLLAVSYLLVFINFVNATALRYVPPATTPVGVTITGPAGTVSTSPITFTITTARPVSVLPASAFTATNGTITSLTQKLALTYSSQFGTTGTSGGTNTLFADPNGIATNGNGIIYIADAGNNRVKILNEGGTQLGVFGTAGTGTGQFNNPYGVALDASGNVYVVDGGNNRVQIFDSNGNFTGTFGSTGSGNGEFSAPRGIHISPIDGSIYVVDAGNNRVQVFNGTTHAYIKTIGSVGSGTGQFYSPSAITSDAAGNIYITDSGNGRVEKFTAAGAYTTTIGGAGSADGQFNSPLGIVADGTGKIYVVDNTLHRVQAFTTTGTFLGKLGGTNPGTANTQFNFPTGIAADKNGKFYVVDQSNQRVSVLTGRSVYTAVIEPTDNGDVILDLAAGKGFDNNGNSNAAASFTVNYFNAVPSAPTGLTGTSLDGKVKLDWAANPVADDILSYKIFWGTNPNPTTLLTSVSGAVTTYTTSNLPLTNGVTYYYRITAVNSISNESPYSSQVSVIPKADQTITAGTIANKVFNDPPFSIANLATASSDLAVEYSIIQGPAQLDAATHTILTITGIGTVKIAVKQPGNNVFHEADEVDVTFDVLPADPNFTVTSPLVITYGTPLTAGLFSKHADVAGDYTYTGLTTPGTVYNSGTNVATIGITFTPLDANYATVTKQVDVNVNKATPAITWNVGSTVAAGSSVAALAVPSVNPNTIAGDWSYSPATVHPGNNQQLTITFTPKNGDENNYETAHKTVTVNVEAIPVTLTWNPSPSTIAYGTPLSADQLNASVDGGIAGQPITYDQPIGKVLEPGDHLITATFTPTDPDYAPATKTATIHVDKIQPVITWNQPAAITFGTLLSTAQLNATTTLTGGTFAYTPDIGAKLPVGNGQQLSVTYTPGAADQAHYAQSTKTVTIDVLPADPNFTVTSPLVITYGTPLTAGLFSKHADVAGDYTYTGLTTPSTVYNSGTNIATIGITFTPYDANYATVTKQVDVNVNKAAPVITWNLGSTVAAGSSVAALASPSVNPNTIAGDWSYSPATVHPGNNQQLTVTFTPKNGDENNYETAHKTVTVNVEAIPVTLTWNPSPSTIAYGTPLSTDQLNASVDGNIAGQPIMYDQPIGKVLEPGDHLITATFTPTDPDYATAIKTATIHVDKIRPVITWNQPAAITYGTLLSTTQLNATTTLTGGTFAYTPDIGAILPAGNGQQLSVTYTPGAADQAHYAQSTKTVTIDVLPADANFTVISPLVITYGTPLTAGLFSKHADVAGDYTYTGLTTPGTVYNAGTNVATIGITFTPSDANYATVTKQVDVNVNKATPVITWNVGPAVAAGSTVAALATPSVSPNTVDGDWSYSPTTVHPGNNQQLTVTFTPKNGDENNYETAHKTVTVNVSQAIPQITWNVPPSVPVGTVIGSAALPQASVASGLEGDFTYSPALGTALSTAGPQQISVTFTPKNATAIDYTSNSKTVTINVTVTNPALIIPQIVWTTPQTITYGAQLGTIQLPKAVIPGTSTQIAGTFDYSIPLTTVLDASNTSYTVIASFTPADQTLYNSANASADVNVHPVTAPLNWDAPAPVPVGTVLTLGVQLNASSTLTGTYAYTPVAGTVLNTPGNQTLQVVFTPDNTNTNYAPATKSVVINVTPAIDPGKITPVIVWHNPADINYGTLLSAVQKSAVLTDASIQGQFDYSFDNNTILSVGPHRLDVTFVPTDNTHYNPATAHVDIVVNAVGLTLTWAHPDAIDYGTALSSTQLNAQATAMVNGTVKNIAGTYVYTPAEGDVLNAGTNQLLSVTFTPTDVNYGPALNTATTITVNKIDPVINWSIAASYPAKTDVSALPRATISPSISGDFTYDPASGPLHPGTGQTIKATFIPTPGSIAGQNYNSVSKILNFDVSPLIPTLTWNPDPSTITNGTPLVATQFNASADNGLTGLLTYNHEAGQVLTMADPTITAHFVPDDHDYQAIDKTITLTINRASPAVTLNNPVFVTYGTPVTAAMINAQANVPGIFTYDGQAAPAATVYPVTGPNSISVVFHPTDIANYTDVIKSVTINVGKAEPIVTFNNPIAITYGTPVTAAMINAQANVLGTFTYNGQAAPAATIYPVGGSNSITVAFHPADAANYSITSNPVTINVNKIIPTVTLNNTVTVNYKTVVTATMINAHANVSGTFTYDGQFTPPATIYTAGGPNTITVVFHPTNSTNYSEVTNTVTINVNKLTPTITWTNPATISYGTALGDAQLYASANVDGKFDYAPAPGTVLAAGNNQPLTVTFTPTDPNYITIPKQVTINVSKVPLIIKADNQSRGYGQPNPAFTLTYTGLVNNDTPASFTSPAVASSVATQASPAGTYAINVSGATSDNYNISYVSGTLTVTTVSRDITFDKLPVKTYGDADFDGGAIATTGEPVIYTSSNPAIATIVDGKIHIVGAGYVTITASLAPNASYNTTPSVSQFMIVNKATQVIDFSSIPAQMRGTTYDLSGIRSSSGLPVTFTVNDEKVASINGLTLSSLRIGVTGIVANQAGNTNYYPAVAVVRDLKVEDPTRDVIVHPAVSPNADGINDFLYIEGIAQHPDNRVTIINRNGVRVYEINGYNNTTKIFDGHSNFTGSMLQAGTYFYLVEYVSDGVGRHLTGYFVLKY